MIRRLQQFATSIRFRLSLWTTTVLVVILLVFSIFVYTRQVYDMQVDTQNYLEAKTRQIELLYKISSLFNTTSGQVELPDLTTLSSTLLSDQEVLVLVKSDGQVLQKAGTIDDSAVLTISNSWKNASQVKGLGTYTVSFPLVAEHNQRILYLFQVTPFFVNHDWAGLMVLGRPIDTNEQLPRLVFTLFLGSLATMVFALAGGYWLAGRAMAPVRTITRTARGISETDLSQRLKLGSKDELGELADTFDAMLDRLQVAFDRQRQFTADASHELRTPLTIVGLETDQALTHHRSVDEYERVLLVIKSENEFMARLVNDLLTLARMDAGQTRLRMEHLDLSDITLEVVERLTPLAHQAGVELDLGEVPQVDIQGDSQYLSQMLANLVENAIKYAGGPGHHVKIDTGVRIDNGKNTGWVRVEDDGPGIPAEALPFLFDRFYRVDKARTRQQDDPQKISSGKNPEGSGLGLSIVYWIIQAHKGQVEISSELGQGSVFIVSLPQENGYAD
jgi:signal transduction histidine kinase